jgi:predicted transcriptional regulator
MTDDTAVIFLVRKESTKRAVLDGVKGKRTPVHPKGAHIMHSFAEVAQVFSRVNLHLLQILHDAGHVSLTDAVKLVGAESVEDFILRTMNGSDETPMRVGLDAGLNLFLDFVPLPDGTPGVRVGFSKLLIDLDFTEHGETA